MIRPLVIVRVPATLGNQINTIVKGLQEFADEYIFIVTISEEVKETTFEYPANANSILSEKQMSKLKGNVISI